MANIKDLKFLEPEFRGKDVSSLSDTPSADGMTARELKKRFDNIGKYMVALGKHNELIDMLSSCDPESGSGAQNIGAHKKVSHDVTEACTVQQRLDELEEEIGGISIEGGDTLMTKSEYAGDTYGYVRNAESAGNSKNAENAEKLGGLTKEQLILTMYPVGSIYMSTSDKSPSTFFGGTWVAWGAGRVPVGINTSDADFNSVEKTAGNKATQVHAHSIPELSGSAVSAGSHAHIVSYNHSETGLDKRIYADWSSGGTAWKYTWNAQSSAPGVDGLLHKTNKFSASAALGTEAVASHTHSVSTVKNTSGSFGGGAASGATNGNLQPYITCYMWKRTG